MPTVESASPHPALLPYIRTYVQREAHLGIRELVEPVVARLGVMLEVEFAGSYEVRNYGSETVEDPNGISVIGPQGWRRSRLIIRGDIESFVVMFQPFGFHKLFGVSTALLSNAGTEGHSLLGREVSRLHEQLGNVRHLRRWRKHSTLFFYGNYRSQRRSIQYTKHLICSWHQTQV